MFTETRNIESIYALMLDLPSETQVFPIANVGKLVRYLGDAGWL